MKNENNFELLRQRSIIDILIGDTNLDDSNSCQIKMPYLSGPVLVEISNHFGLAAQYNWSGGALSRWCYMDALIQHCIENETIQDLLSFLFSKAQFSELLSGLSIEKIDQCYRTITMKAFAAINGQLYFGNHVLCLEGSMFVVHSIGTTVVVQTPVLANVDRDYIKDIAERATEDINQGHLDSAITKARTVLEETFCYVIERKGIEPACQGDIGKLYGQVKDLYNMHGDKTMDKRINILLSGLEKIVASIAEMRNENSDSHGVGSKRIAINDYHARLMVNASTAMADFILSVSNNSKC